MTKNKYEILNLADFSAIHQVKSAFKSIILQHHPDKVKIRSCDSQQEKSKETAKTAETEIWQNILDAYDTLGNENLKQIYDSQLKRLLKEGPVQESVDLDDMQEILVECSNHSPNNNNNGTEDSEEECSCKTFWKKTCRCGGDFAVCETDLENGVQFVGCDGCSLFIHILYQQISENDQ